VLQLTREYFRLKSRIVRELLEAARSSEQHPLSWLARSEQSTVDVSMPALEKSKAKEETKQQQQQQQVKQAVNVAPHTRIVAVSSCKGGVGKSTVAVNYAYALSAQGYRVALFDADIYGPSLPTLLAAQPQPVRIAQNPDTGLLEAPEFRGVPSMSYGYLQQQQGNGDDAAAAAAIMRGPMAGNVLKQLLSDTSWGSSSSSNLDYLVLDLPPGTGDVQITLAQLLRIDAAIVVTTPQLLSHVDVVKGLHMWQKVSVPVVAAVENMAYFLCGACSTEHELFGKGHAAQLSREFGIPVTARLPLLEAVAACADAGLPAVLSSDDALQPYADVYRSLAQRTTIAIDELAASASLAKRALTFNKALNVLELTSPNLQEPLRVAPRTLRLHCRCAACVDEVSGAARLVPDTVPEDVHPLGMQAKGHYAMAIHWSDGHASSIYPWTAIEEAAATCSK
jgi:Mrp family chromosome partitioning ATPase/DUF971 family protein